MGEGLDLLRKMIANLPESERNKFLDKFCQDLAIGMIRATQPIDGEKNVK